jgi:sec-independent protein translocase protein TatC
MALDQVDVDKWKEEDSDQNNMSFFDHLEALRWHLMRSAIAVLLAGIFVFINKSFVFDTLIIGPKSPDFWTYRMICKMSDVLCFSPPKFTIITRDLGEQFLTHFKVSMTLGFILAFPYVFWEIWRFIKPGLYKSEQKAARGIVFICSLLFFMGNLFGYFIMSPFAVSFLAGYQVGDVMTTPTLGSYVSYMTMLTLPIGIVFEMPVLIFFLAKIGLVGSDFLKSYRRLAFLLIFIMAAIITPPDLVTQFIIGIPLYFLYEISIAIVMRVEKQELNSSKD